MIFNSFEYLIFLPTVLMIYYSIPFQLKSLFLLISSYYFYMCWNPYFIILILGSTTIDFYCSLKMTKSQNRKPYLYLSIITNLSLLFIFKYLTFATSSFNLIFNSNVPMLTLLLPMGISFYTFQSMSYTIDVYSRSISPEKHFGIFALFISFFPQLVAGPIERSSSLLPQLKSFKPFNHRLFISGLRKILIGCFKKVVIADNISHLITPYFNDPGSYSGVPLLFCTVLFSYQIYCDFSGYSDIAIGSARLLGIRLNENFNLPYHATSFSDFWSRWHISLSTWFRDYIYIPLGGNRVIKWRSYYNIFITFLISGIWHGANTTFIIWGIIHGLLLILEKIYLSYRKTRTKRPQTFTSIIIKRLFIFTTICLTWVIFRANSISDALIIYKSFYSSFVVIITSVLTQNVAPIIPLIKNQSLSSWFPSIHYLILAILILEIYHYLKVTFDIFKMPFFKITVLRWTAYATLCFWIIFGGNHSKIQFIYFQF